MTDSDFTTYSVSAGSLLLVRHGQTEWSRLGKHTGRSDIPLTETGREAARALATQLAERRFALARSSPLVRAHETATLAGLSVETDPRLAEWDYGIYEGRTADDIEAQYGDEWTIWAADGVRYPAPAESLDEVAERVEPVIEQARAVVGRGEDAVIVAHGHLLRILASRWIGAPASMGQALALDTTAFGVLSIKRGQPVIRKWNVAALSPSD